MSERYDNIQKKLHRLTTISSLLIGLILITWGSIYLNHDWNDRINEGFKTNIVIVGAIWTAIGFSLLLLKRTQHFGSIVLSLFTINLFYLIGEIITYLLISLSILSPRVALEDSGFGSFNKPCARYDSISGYKWLPVEGRVTKIVGKEIIFDHRFKVNNKGYLSDIDYQFEKQDSSTIRYLVFGDSFTAGLYLEQSWPKYLQKKLTEQHEGRFEIYSFAIDGAGLFNWHTIFMNEIIPFYDFDGIIIAAWGNDFSRDFAIMHHEDDLAYFNYFDKVPENYIDFQNNYLPNMWNLDLISDSLIDKKLESTKSTSKSNIQFANPDLHLLMKIYDRISNSLYQKKQSGFEEKFIASRDEFIKHYTIQSFIDNYGSARFAKIDTMLQYCKQNDKQVIFCTQADEYGIRSLKIGDHHWMQGELEGLASHYNVEYFDGLKYYVDLSEEEIGDCFLKFDPHWSQKGSDIFAKNFYTYFVNLHKDKLQ